MVALSEADRQKVWRGLMRYWSIEFDSTSGFDKYDLQDAVDATDNWIDDNQVSFNTVLPEPAKTNLTQAQKSVLFCAVTLARVSIDLLKKVFGEVE